MWSKEGLDRLVLLEGRAACAALEPRRLCLAHARFTQAAPPGASAGGAVGAPRELVVDGCADENDLLESRLAATRAASVGPVDWRRRCAPLPARPRGCEPSYLALLRIEHEANADARAGFGFSWDGDRFGACFLERDAGRYRIELLVEDSCGAHETLTLRGDSSELD